MCALCSLGHGHRTWRQLLPVPPGLPGVSPDLQTPGWVPWAVPGNVTCRLIILQSEHPENLLEHGLLSPLLLLTQWV